MRLILLTIVITVTAVATATLKPATTDNALAFSNARSREFAMGDSGRPRGWRECVEIESTPSELGIVCEGTRAIVIPRGQMTDVNYFCEFRFLAVEQGWYRLDYQLCQ